MKIVIVEQKGNMGILGMCSSISLNVDTGSRTLFDTPCPPLGKGC